MRAATASLPYLPPAGQVAWVEVDERWSAVSLPGMWGSLVVDVLADHAGPVLEDPAVLRLIWPLPPGGAEHWPDASGGGVVRHRIGDGFLVPGPGGYHPGTRWARHPNSCSRYADPALLRAGIEAVAGPLADLGALGPLVVCASCRTPTRHSADSTWRESLSGPGASSYTCRSCWADQCRGGPGRHLRLVRGGTR
ncbi:hypothetical protein [Streptomyces lichenis]|uniref:Uncharacterized protein n=1 Tax=Streptomyces lichenis TaxID=2306967 RepID=A0ABT0I9I4_9ACTN|nr:hypothetical protein [Streptomyces lichenis]MCK8677989.1 hypothetical protein [Streptomyces lichenis]